MMKKLLPPHFNHGVILEDYTYYGSLNFDDFSVIATGEITNPLRREIVQQNAPKVISRFSAKTPEQEVKQFVDLVNKPTSFIFTLDKAEVKTLKKMSREIVAQDKTRMNGRNAKGSKLVFEPKPDNKLLIRCEIIPENSAPYLGGFESFNMTLKNVTFDKRFELQCDQMRCLPDGELEVKYSEKGLISFNSTKKSNAVHFVTH